MSDFKYISFFYDPLARLVFGNNLANAKKQFIDRVKPGSVILIFGGGTGDILNDMLSEISNCTIDFIEPSSGMIRMAKKKLHPEYTHRVNFIHGNQICIPNNMQYDAVAVFFVLDVFKQQEALVVSIQLNASLKKDGIWLFADFFPALNYFQKWMMRIMYLFFKVTTGISASRLPEYESIFTQNRLTLTHEKYFLNGWVRSKVYLK